MIIISTWYCPPERIKNQGGETTCGANAIAQIAELYWERKLGKYTKFSVGFPSAFQLNPDILPIGMSPFEIGEIMIQYGICEFPLLPQDHDNPEILQYVTDKDKLIQNASQYKFKAYQYIETLDEIKEALKTCPVLLATSVPSNFYSLNQYNYKLPDIKPTGAFIGHFTVISDVTDDGYVEIINSYGSNWGKNGTCLIPFHYFSYIPLTKFMSFTPYEEVKPLEIQEQLLFHNRSHETLNPQGFVIHSTDTEGATAQNEYVYFNTGERQASVHYFADWYEIIRTIPENEVAWHAGFNANHAYLSVEMCEPYGYDVEKFNAMWNNTVWLVADACVRYGWNTNDDVYSHRGISAMYPSQTDHQDPIAFLAKYSKTWQDLLNAIDNKINELKNPTSTTQSNQTNNQGDENQVEKAILIFGQDDLPTVKRLMEKIENVPVIFRNSDATAPTSIQYVKQLFVVGGKQDGSDVNHPNKVVLAGADWFATADAVANYIKTH